MAGDTPASSHSANVTSIVSRRAGRVLDATSAHRDDPSLWRLRRSRVRPLRVTLTGPAAEIVLDQSGRKAIEVAQWASRRGCRTLTDRGEASRSGASASLEQDAAGLAAAALNSGLVQYRA